jgi:hypothetical protein
MVMVIAVARWARSSKAGLDESRLTVAEDDSVNSNLAEYVNNAKAAGGVGLCICWEMAFICFIGSEFMAAIFPK